MSFARGLKCRECGRPYPHGAVHVCEFCFGPLEVDYDYPGIKQVLTRETIESRPPTMWRYRELLPLEGEPTVGLKTGFTPLIRAERLAQALGVKEVYVKNDSVCHPSLSFKDRVVAVAISRAREFGMEVMACASTGNLANAVAAQSASSGHTAYVFIPSDLEAGKILGTLCYGANVVGIQGNYDAVNRLCSEIADKYRWAFVNINLRPYYAEGSKTLGYEVAEQLGWRAPRNIVVPMAGGSLITKIGKAFRELEMLGPIPSSACRIFGAQATGCNPITAMVKEGRDFVKPVKPNTIAKSIAIGNPADGYYAAKTMRESGGWGEDVSDEEIVEAILLLAKTEGIFTETAGGVTLGVAKKLIEQGRISKEESLVICITGNGMKTIEALEGKVPEVPTMAPKLTEFDKLYPSLQS